MSEYSREQLSALLDDELGDEAGITLKALGNNPGHRQVWSRYNLIGECLRGNLPEHVDPKIADKVRAVIEHEPAILAPDSKTSRFLKPVMGFAIAASVAVVVILGLQQSNTNPSFVPVQPLAKHQSKLSNQRLATIDTQQQAGQRIRQLPVAKSADAGSRLNRYLVNYNEYRANAGMQGILPYVRIVAYETDDQEQPAE